MSQKKFLVFSRDDCPWCDAVKALLAEKDIEFDVINLSTDSASLEWFREEGFRTVPQVYHGKKWIGGYERTKDYVHEIANFQA